MRDGTESCAINVRERIARAKAEITNDINNGRVPSTITSFAELHDYVDANEYGGLCDEDVIVELVPINEIQNMLDIWLRAGRPNSSVASTLTKGTYCARAQVTRTECLSISIEMRSPKKGELGWTVSMDADVKEALLQVLDGRGSWDEGDYGYGLRAEYDWPEVERDEWVEYEIDPATGRSNGRVKERGVHESRCITVVVAWEGTQTGEVVLL